MPTYEYECTKCGHAFEEFRSISDKPRQRCPECRGKVQQVISGGIGLLFKGDGFYCKESRRQERLKAEGKERSDGEVAKADGKDPGRDAAAKKPAKKGGKKGQAA
jgi:putative FmdB family regulatory protein